MLGKWQKFYEQQEKVAVVRYELLYFFFQVTKNSGKKCSFPRLKNQWSKSTEIPGKGDQHEKKMSWIHEDRINYGKV